jgi:putative ABC transport system ATP-binding protein
MGFVSLDQLALTYQAGAETVYAVSDLSVRISRGEFAAVVGPSGCGKSTLLAALGGLKRPSAGSIVIDEIDLASLTPDQLADFRREYVGFVFQSFHLVPYLSVRQNVLLPLAVTDTPAGERKELAEAVLRKVGLEAKGSRLPGELSGGEQQRAALARALVRRPPLLLADEPTGNLDSSTGRGIMDLLERLHADGHTVVMVSHNPEHARRAGRHLELRDGRLVPESTHASFDASGRTLGV